MDLTRLPQHILQNIVTLAVTDSKLRKGLRLRQVCKLFDREVQHAIFERDEKGLFDLVVARHSKLPETVLFRCIRGFILRRNQRDRQQQLWSQLDCAIPALSLYVPKACAHTEDPIKRPSPDRFMNLYADKGNNEPFERAIAMLCDALFTFVGNNWDPLSLMCADWYRYSDYWEVLRDKTSNFWVMAVAARRNDLDLCQSLVTSLKDNPDLDQQVVAQHLVDSLRLPAEHGFDEMVTLLLNQEGVEMRKVRKRLVPDMGTTLELAIDHGRDSTVRTLLSRGWDILELPQQYAACLQACVNFQGDRVMRNTLLTIFLDLTNEWQSESIMVGLTNGLCQRGDLETLEMVVNKYKMVAGDKAQYQWGWSGDLGTFALWGAIESHQAALVEYLIENREMLGSIVQTSFDADDLLRCVKLAISEKQPDILQVLLGKSLPGVVVDKTLFAYAAITGDSKCLEILLPSVDLAKKIDEEMVSWQDETQDLQFTDKMYEIRGYSTSLLTISGLLTFGAFCLIIALKAYNIEAVEFLLKKNVTIGRRYVELTRNHQCRNAALLTRNDADLPGKGTIIGITPKYRDALSCKHMLNQGARMTKRTLLVSRKCWEKQNEEATISKDDKQVSISRSRSKLKSIIDRLKPLHFSTSHKPIKEGVRVVWGIEVPPMRYLDLEEDDDDDFNDEHDNDNDDAQNEDTSGSNTEPTGGRGSERARKRSKFMEETYNKFDTMFDLLWKYKQPFIYVDI